MKDIDTLLPRVLGVASACPEPTAITALRDAAIDFCRRTRVWRESDSFVINGDGEDDIVVGDDRAVFEISHAQFDDADLTPKTMDWLDANDPGWRDREGIPAIITQLAPDTLRLVPIPDESGTLTLQLVLIPSQRALRLPDVLINTYAQVITDGALARVLMLPAEFGNAQLAVAHRQLYEDAIGRWADHIPLGQQRAVRRTQASFF